MKYLARIIAIFILVLGMNGVSAGAAGMEEINAFPVSYRDALLQLKTQHPQWSFVPMQVECSFDYAVQKEMEGSRSLVHSSKGEAWRKELYSPGWYYATEQAVRYCMDPRNFLTEESVFMFEQLTLIPSVHTEEGVQKILQKSFMSDVIPADNPNDDPQEDGVTTYAQLFYRVGNYLKVSPYHLACRVYQEQGAKGTSPLISGTQEGYEGYYNFFNVKASGSTNEEIIRSGLEYAMKVGWHSRSASIEGGSAFVSQNYILKGQDTLYLQKFDVDPTFHGMFAHQYQQNITAPITEGATIRKAYEAAGAMENAFVFKIPVYRDMPAEACPKPVKGVVVQPTDPTTAFVSRMYTVALGRDYDPAGLQDWTNQLKDGKIDGAGIAVGFIGSEEFRNRRLSDGSFVDVLYRTFFDREPDETGKAGWMTDLAQGKSREYVLSGFVNSQEFADLAARFGIKQGYLYPNGYARKEGLEGYVERMYLCALNRMPEAEGKRDWMQRISSKTMTPKEVAKSFFDSLEFQNRRLSNADYLETLYQTFLNRASDAQGKNDWMQKLGSGQLTRSQVLDGFADSLEFGEIVKSFGL